MGIHAYVYIAHGISMPVDPTLTPVTAVTALITARAAFPA